MSCRVEGGGGTILIGSRQLSPPPLKRRRLVRQSVPYLEFLLPCFYLFIYFAALFGIWMYAVFKISEKELRTRGRLRQCLSCARTSIASPQHHHIYLRFSFESAVQPWCHKAPSSGPPCVIGKVLSTYLISSNIISLKKKEQKSHSQESPDAFMMKKNSTSSFIICIMTSELKHNG